MSMENLEYGYYCRLTKLPKDGMNDWELDFFDSVVEKYEEEWMTADGKDWRPSGTVERVWSRRQHTSIKELFEKHEPRQSFG